jgi:hypothetical protein
MPKQEFLSGGLVTSRDSAMLGDGELAVAEDVLLKPGSPSLFKAPGRGRATLTALPSSIDGLGYASFDGAADRLVAVAGGSYYTAPPEPASTPASLATGAGSTLDIASLTNRIVLMSGGTNKVLLKDGTSRAHGMQPVTAAPGSSVVTSGGTNIFAVLGVGWFDYWTTEVYKVGDEDVESTFTGTPAIVNVTTSDSIVTISRPEVLNDSATHWRIYRSNRKVNQADNTGFPLGFKIGELPIATKSFQDGGATALTDKLPTTTSVPSNSAGTWSSLPNILTDDTLTADWDSNSGAYGRLLLGGFAITGIAEPIMEIKVKIKAKANFANQSQISAKLSWDGGTTFTSATATTPLLSTSLAVYTLTLGTWGRTWRASEFADGTFFVHLTMIPIDNGDLVNVDYVKVDVVHGGTTLSTATPFPAIFITAGPAKASVGANGLPPNADTGDIFQGSLVTNNVAHPTEVAWTIPGTIDYSPVVYRLSIDTKNKDSVKCIRTLSNVCMIGSESQVHRLNFLPLQDDPEFNTGRAVELVDPDEGMVGPLAACLFTYGGREPRMFYVGRNYLRMSNGYSADNATDDIFWGDMLSLGEITRCRAVNIVLYSEILVYYSDNSGARKVLRLNYHPMHLKNGKLKVVGVTNYSAKSAADGVTSDGSRVLYTGRTDGFIYSENQGYTDASGSGINPLVRTRDISQGEGKSWEVDQLGITHANNIGAQLDVSYFTTLANYPDRESPPQSLTMAGRQMSVITQGDSGDTVAVQLAGQDDGKPWTIDNITLFGSDQGETAPLKR